MQAPKSKLIISQSPISLTKFQEIIPPLSVVSTEPTQLQDLIELPTPIVSVLFCIQSQQSKFQPLDLSLSIQLQIKGQPVTVKTLKQISSYPYLYSQLLIDSCVCYQKLITLIATVKYAQSITSKTPESVQQLCGLLASRSYTLHNQKIVQVFRRNIIIKQPVESLYRYSASGYIYLQCRNLQQKVVKIKQINLHNWTVSNNENLKLFESKSTLEEPVQLLQKQIVGVMMSIVPNLNKQEIPYQITYEIEGIPNEFKILKFVYLQ